MKINEYFESLQGEGKFSGYPALFIRLSGCNNKCEFCDTKYHKEGKNISKNKIIKIINNYKGDIVVWTGGEPTLQIEDIIYIINHTNKLHHLETNCFKLNIDYLTWFDYIAFSPKNLNDTKRLSKFINNNILNINNYDIKIVTDLKMNKNLIKYATFLMPLTTYTPIDEEINKNVWNYCVEKRIKFCSRLQKIWGMKKGI